MAKRRTLQLVRTKEFHVECEENDYGELRWKGYLKTVNGVTLERVSITDPRFIEEEELDYYDYYKFPDCLITLSLGMPFRWNEGDDFYCYKLIAGVINLDREAKYREAEYWAELERKAEAESQEYLAEFHEYLDRKREAESQEYLEREAEYWED
ncbi:MAG: hypothetical protein QNJ68_01570 [Microcoleaceae cyanobacterium MO_207.B10]|nr:hypothetical protein [Microcoleaceae cyanobacterium MO_207.B10]